MLRMRRGVLCAAALRQPLLAAKLTCRSTVSMSAWWTHRAAACRQPGCPLCAVQRAPWSGCPPSLPRVYSARATVHLLPCAATLLAACLPSNAGSPAHSASKGMPWQAATLLAACLPSNAGSPAHSASKDRAGLGHAIAGNCMHNVPACSRWRATCARARARRPAA